MYVCISGVSLTTVSAFLNLTIVITLIYLATPTCTCIKLIISKVYIYYIHVAICLYNLYTVYVNKKSLYSNSNYLSSTDNIV